MSPNRTSLTSLLSAITVFGLAVVMDKLDWAIVFAIAVFLMLAMIFVTNIEVQK
ncbi:MAG: hypothetical protein KJI69_04960 [Patescibacteria group bacterium]|nr:hypothetical protein [Patescibacteria group bacterium]